jgi:hypothetical protein
MKSLMYFAGIIFASFPSNILKFIVTLTVMEKTKFHKELDIKSTHSE